jgi:hypothetical protein
LLAAMSVYKESLSTMSIKRRNFKQLDPRSHPSARNLALG